MSNFYTPAKTTMKRRNWCGPYALAVLFGCSYDRAYELAKAWLDRPAGITGMWKREMLFCIEMRRLTTKSGIRATPIPTRDIRVARETGRGTVWKPKTLTQFYRGRPDTQGTYLVAITGHYVVIKGTRIIDNLTGEWEPMHKRKRMKRSYVNAVWKIEK